MITESGIFERDNFTDFENLLFAQREIKELKQTIKDRDVEIGKLNSFIVELSENKDGEILSNDLKKELNKNRYVQELNKMYAKLNTKYQKVKSQLNEKRIEISKKGVVVFYDTNK